MSLSSSLFSGVSGLSTLGNAMTVIGDNIANVNTIGFKSSRATFQDVLSQTVATQSGTSQVGRGSTLGDIVSIFGQGSFESTESATDLAIGGDGFFIVRHPENENSEFYTRAGEFRFNKDGYFVNPAGYIVRGWELQRNETTGDVEDVGSITDVQLASFTSPPEETDRITVITNLDSRGEDSSEITATNPDPLSTAWNGDTSVNGLPISDTAYEYQTTVKVYDSLGSTHDITIYFDCGDKAATEPTYEYIVTCNPSEDERNMFDNATTDAGLGMLGKGMLTFDSSGVLKDMSFSRFIGNSGGFNIDPAAVADVYGDWTQTDLAFPVTYTFTESTGSDVQIGNEAVTLGWSDGTNSGTVTIPQVYNTGDIVEGPHGMRLTFTKGDTIAAASTFDVTVDQGDSNDLSDDDCWAEMTTSEEDLINQHFTFTPDFLGGSGGTAMSIELDLGAAYGGTAWNPDSLSTTQYASASTTVFQSSTGYGAGDLQSVSVDTDGVITGQYSNGQVTPLFRVGLAKFQNIQGLYKEGGSLYRETRTSGSAITGRPGSNGLGSIAPNSLEQSNVDMAQEFVKMITTQRGFQANSKIITTVDSMLNETINLKR